MFAKLFCVATILSAISATADAAEQGAPPIPASLVALNGCWAGSGEVVGKPVTTVVNAHPIVLEAMMTLDAASSAVADPEDRYAAHLVFGGAGKPSGAQVDPIVGYWADSFGGAFAAMGRGVASADGFEITYQYASDAFVNRWHFSGGDLKWQIVARDEKGVEKPFASYVLRQAMCRP